MVRFRKTKLIYIMNSFQSILNAKDAVRQSDAHNLRCIWNRANGLIASMHIPRSKSILNIVSTNRAVQMQHSKSNCMVISLKSYNTLRLKPFSTDVGGKI